MRTSLRLWPLFLLLACGGSDDDDGDGTSLSWPTTCDAVDSSGPQAGLCFAWDGEQTADHEDFQELCESTYGGAYSDAACPEAPIALCDTDQGAGLLLTYQYYAPTWDLTTAQAHCEGLASCSFSCVFEAL